MLRILPVWGWLMDWEGFWFESFHAVSWKVRGWGLQSPCSALGSLRGCFVVEFWWRHKVLSLDAFYRCVNWSTNMKISLSKVRHTVSEWVCYDFRPHALSPKHSSFDQQFAHVCFLLIPVCFQAALYFGPLAFAVILQFTFPFVGDRKPVMDCAGHCARMYSVNSDD